MTNERVTPLEERREIVQDVIDRLLYLSPQELVQYKETLSLMHKVFSVDVKIVDGIRIYSVNKNLQ